PRRLGGRRPSQHGPTLRLDPVPNGRKPLRRQVFFTTPRPRHFRDDGDIFEVRHTPIVRPNPRDTELRPAGRARCARTQWTQPNALAINAARPNATKMIAPKRTRKSRS